MKAKIESWEIDGENVNLIDVTGKIIDTAYIGDIIDFYIESENEEA